LTCHQSAFLRTRSIIIDSNSVFVFSFFLIAVSVRIKKQPEQQAAALAAWYPEVAA
jgi:hypothetical protein